MLLMDRVYEWARQQQPYLVPSLLEASRFTFDDRSFKTCRELTTRYGGKVRSQRDYLILPHQTCWFEWMPSPGIYHGLLYIGAGINSADSYDRSVDAGSLQFFVFNRFEMAENELDMAGAGVFDKRHTEVAYIHPLLKSNLKNLSELLNGRLPSIDRLKVAPINEASSEHIEATNNAANLLIVFLATLASPKFVRTEFVSRERINAARAKKKKFALLDHSVVRINLSDYEYVTRTRAQDTIGISREGKATVRCLHPVRAHVRIRRGQLETVKPHWRGDGELGIKNHTRYQVTDKGRRR